jgi:hypothetical protein
MKKTLTMFVAVLAMLLTASAPLVLAQQAPTSLPEEPAIPAPPSENVSTDPAPTDPAPTDPAPTDPAVSEPSPPSEPAPTTTTTPTAGPAVGCQELYQDPETFCIVDEDGDITRPDGTKAPVVVNPKKAVFMVNEDGTLAPIGTGASFIVDDATSGSTGQVNPTEETDTAPDTTPISTDPLNPPEGNHNTPDSTEQDKSPEENGNSPSVSEQDKTPTGNVQYTLPEGA